jgi:transposase
MVRRHERSDVHQHWASRFAVDRIALAVIQAPKLEPRIMRYELTDYEWAAVRPFLPNRPRGVPRVNDRRVSATPVLNARFVMERKSLLRSMGRVTLVCRPNPLTMRLAGTSAGVAIQNQAPLTDRASEEVRLN